MTLNFDEERESVVESYNSSLNASKNHYGNKSMRESLTDVLIGSQQKTSSWSAAWNITNIIQGIGILGLPYAMLMGGWVGVLLNLLAGVVSCSTGKMIIDCLYEEIGEDVYDDGNSGQKMVRVLDDYPDIGAKVWPRFGRPYVALVSVIEMFGATTLYLILLSSSLNVLCVDLLPDFNPQYWYVIAAMLVFTMLSIRQIAVISWFSLIAIIALFTIIVGVVSFCLSQAHHMSTSNFPTPLCWPNIPISTGIIVFSYCAHPVLPAIETAMRHPTHFSRVMNVSFIIATFSKTLFGLVPLFLFGPHTAQSITNNVVKDHIVFYIVTKVVVIVNALFSLPMIIYVLSDRIDQSLLFNYFPATFWPRRNLHYLWVFVTRLILMLSVLLTALKVPYFALVMSFVGSFTGTNLAFVLPSWFSLRLKWPRLSSLQIVYRISIIVFGSIIGLVGMFFSARSIATTARLPQ